MRHVIIHYHIFKNAGSTVAAALARNFGSGFASFDTPFHNKRIQPDELIAFVKSNPSVFAISSHHLRLPAPKLPDIHFHEILILRNPLDRLRSMYDFYRRVSINNDPLTREAKRLNLSQFFSYVLESFPNLITNSQLNLVANGGARVPDVEDARKGAAMLSDIAVVGVAENFDECAITAESSLKGAFPNLDLSYAPENVSPGRGKDLESRLRSLAETCGTELYQRLRSANELDDALVRAAALESARRFRELSSAQEQLCGFVTRVARRKVLYEKARRRLRLQHLWKRATRPFSSFMPG